MAGMAAAADAKANTTITITTTASGREKGFGVPRTLGPEDISDELWIHTNLATFEVSRVLDGEDDSDGGGRGGGGSQRSGKSRCTFTPFNAKAVGQLPLWLGEQLRKSSGSTARNGLSSKPGSGSGSDSSSDDEERNLPLPQSQPQENGRQKGAIKLVVFKITKASGEKEAKHHIAAFLDALEIEKGLYPSFEAFDSRFCALPLPLLPDSYPSNLAGSMAQTLGFYITSASPGLCWRYNPRTCTSIGVLFFVEWKSYAVKGATGLLRGLAELPHLLWHPLLLASLYLEVRTRAMRLSVSTRGAEVRKKQIQSGFHNYSEGDTGVVDGNVDLGELSGVMSGLATKLETYGLSAWSLQQLANSLLDQRELLNRCNLEVDKAEIELASKVMEQRATFWGAENAFLIQKTASLRQRCSIVVQGIFSLIAQREAQLSIDIAKETGALSAHSASIADKSAMLAEESIQDSTSMKAIAGVTMMFLPGTFVASFLAIPLFDFNESTDSLVSRQFWLYWAITAPLTVLTIVAWFLWNWWSISHRRRSRRPFKGRKI